MRQEFKEDYEYEYEKRPLPLYPQSLIRIQTSQQHLLASNIQSIIGSPQYQTNRPVAATNGPVAATSRPVATTNRPFADINRPVAATSRPFADINRPFADINRPVAATSRPVATSNRPVAATNRPVAATNRPVISNASAPYHQKSKYATAGITNSARRDSTDARFTEVATPVQVNRKRRHSDDQENVEVIKRNTKNSAVRGRDRCRDTTVEDRAIDKAAAAFCQKTIMPKRKPCLPKSTNSQDWVVVDRLKSTVTNQVVRKVTAKTCDIEKYSEQQINQENNRLMLKEALDGRAIVKPGRCGTLPLGHPTIQQMEAIARKQSALNGNAHEKVILGSVSRSKNRISAGNMDDGIHTDPTEGNEEEDDEKVGEMSLLSDTVGQSFHDDDDNERVEEQRPSDEAVTSSEYTSGSESDNSEGGGGDDGGGDGGDGVSTNGASTDGIRSDGVCADGVRSEGGSADGISANGGSADGVSTDGVSTDGVSGDGVSGDVVCADGVSTDGGSADGVSADGGSGYSIKIVNTTKGPIITKFVNGVPVLITTAAKSDTANRNALIQAGPKQPPPILITQKAMIKRGPPPPIPLTHLSLTPTYLSNCNSVGSNVIYQRRSPDERYRMNSNVNTVTSKEVVTMIQRNIEKNPDLPRVNNITPSHIRNVSVVKFDKGIVNYKPLRMVNGTLVDHPKLISSNNIIRVQKFMAVDKLGSAEIPSASSNSPLTNSVAIAAAGKAAAAAIKLAQPSTLAKNHVTEVC